jgi:hypothetical protein
MNYFIKFIILAAFIALGSGCSYGAGKICAKNTISGADLRAYAAVYTEFSRALPQGNSENELQDFMSSAANYEIRIADGDKIYTFDIRPKMFHGRRLFGGGSKYTVEKSSYKVLLVSRSK